MHRKRNGTEMKETEPDLFERQTSGDTKTSLPKTNDASLRRLSPMLIACYFLLFTRYCVSTVDYASLP
jgi:hypothetical protein